MTSRLSPVKILSLTCEQSVGTRLLEVLRKNGVRSARVTEARVEELDGDSAVDLNVTQLVIECVISSDAVTRIVDILAAEFLPRYDVGFFIHDANVLRPEVFVKQ